VIAKSGRPRVRLVPVPERRSPRAFGQLKDQIVFHVGWEEDVTDEFEDL
jgi:antitoxin (DNA-binding transcriptional repressor) of toxin-antitoxin stability system